MPATTEPAGHRWGSERKTDSATLRSRHFVATGLRNPVFAGIDLLDEVTLDERRERARDVLPGEIEIQRDQRRALDREDLGVRERFEDPILALRHPVGSVPETHTYAAVLAPGLSNVAWGSLGVALYYAFVTKYKAIAPRHVCNDRPGALRSRSLRAGAADPRPGGRSDTTMSTNTAAGLESRHTTDALAVIERADRAYHDPAQLHLHEFGGGGA